MNEEEIITFEQKIQKIKEKLNDTTNTELQTNNVNMNNQNVKINTETRIITFTSNDERLHKIIDNIPKDILNYTLEKYIIIGNMVTNYASISESKETMKNMLIPINADIIIPLKTEIDNLRQQIRMIIPTISIPTNKGNITQETVFKNLTEYFMDDSFEDVSKIGKYSDIISHTSEYNELILIETKEWTSPIPTEQVEKFWRDMEVRDCKYGIFISMRTNISKISGALKIEIRNGRTVIFIINSELNWKGHIFAYYTIRKIINFEVSNKRNTSKDELITLIPLINKKAMEIRKDIEMLDELISIIEELKSINTRKLETVRNKISEYKRNVDIKIKDIINDIEKLEVN